MGWPSTTDEEVPSSDCPTETPYVQRPAKKCLGGNPASGALYVNPLGHFALGVNRSASPSDRGGRRARRPLRQGEALHGGLQARPPPDADYPLTGAC
jgi:hypothetical protein